MTFWGYLVLLFFVGLTIEEYLLMRHHLEIERIELVHKLNDKEEEAQ